MPTIRLPNNWAPRAYQEPAWDYLENGGRYASLWWHRRAGKDDVCLHRAAVASQERIGNYWHMLPQASQSRKAIWHAVDPRTGKRRIDTAFPDRMRKKTLENEMFIEFKNGSTWQVIGSDNYQALVGTPPVGIVFSEWSKAHPFAWAYLSPILLENGGWAVFITTPMGKNHAFNTHESFRQDPDCYTETLTALDTDVFTEGDLAGEKQRYIDIYGHTLGTAMYEQEYMCSAEAAVLGAVYAEEIAAIRAEGRIFDFLMAPAPVYTAWDLGRTDATAIWWFQVVAGEIRVLDYTEDSLKDIDCYVERIRGRKIENDVAEWAYGHHKIRWGAEIEGIKHRIGYDYKMHFLPHDAAQQRLEARGVSIEAMVRKALSNVTVVRAQGLPLSSQIAMARNALKRAYFTPTAAKGLEIMSNYRYDYHEERRKLSDKPIHDWTSHCADAWRVLSVATADLLAQSAAPIVTLSKQRMRPRKSIWAR